MREIKFRGQTWTTEGKKWVYGNYYKVKSFFNNTEGYFIEMIKNNHLNDFSIDENTLGQYTGLKDLDNNELYEGDIIQHYFEYYDETDRYTIEWDEDNLQYVFRNIKNKNNYIALEDLYSEDIGDYAIRRIGNIYDNPELLEKEGIKYE